MVSFRQLMSAEMLDELLPTHEFFRILDRRVILKSEEYVPAPADRFMVICAEANEEWSSLLADNCTGEYTGDLWLPASLADLRHHRWMTGPNLPTYLGISSYSTRVAICGQYVYVCVHIGA